MGHWQQCKLGDLELVPRNPECVRSTFREGDIVKFINPNPPMVYYSFGFEPGDTTGEIAIVDYTTATVRFHRDVGGWGIDYSIEEFMEDSSRVRRWSSPREG